jgi:hypothetical protein
VQVYKTRRFSRWAKKEKITDQILLRATREIDSGLAGVNLGGNVYKKRLELRGLGKRGGARVEQGWSKGGARVVYVYKSGSRLFFVFGFSKTEKANVAKEELEALKELAKDLLGYNQAEIAQWQKTDSLEELENG